MTRAAETLGIADVLGRYQQRGRSARYLVTRKLNVRMANGSSTRDSQLIKAQADCLTAPIFDQFQVAAAQIHFPTLVLLGVIVRMCNR